MRHIRQIFLVVLCLFFLCAMGQQAAFAQNAPSQIRDAEIENLLRDYANPIFKAAGLNPDAVNLYILDSPQLNAFVTGGQNIFIYTGLILETETPLELVAVLAHETGHISGGHLIQMSAAVRDAQMQMLIATLLGAAAAIGSGEAGAGAAAATAGQQVALRSFLRHTRGHENAADQAAVTYLVRAGFSPKGAVSFMQKLYEANPIAESVDNDYLRTHPLTLDRIQAMQQAVLRTAMMDLSDMAEFKERHERMRAKIMAYQYPRRIRFLYGERDQSTPALYAKAMAAFRQSDLKSFEGHMAKLLEREPENPYFHELRGQAYFELGQVDEGLLSLARADELLPNNPLVMMLYAHALSEKQGQENLKKAADLMRRTLKAERPSAWGHRLMATIYGRLGQENHARLHLAEEALLKGDKKYAETLAQEAVKVLEQGTPEWQRAQDIIHFSQ